MVRSSAGKIFSLLTLALTLGQPLALYAEMIPKKVKEVVLETRRGKRGPQGLVGPAGAVGPVGPTGNVLPFRYDLFVSNTSTAATPDGSISFPYPTIQAAINAVVADTPSSPNVDYTLLIAGGNYAEDLVVQGADNKHIVLQALSEVIVSSITWNITSTTASPFIPSLTINSADNIVAGGMDIVHQDQQTGKFLVTGNVTVNNSLTDGAPTLSMRAKVNGNIACVPQSVSAQPTALSLFDSIVNTINVPNFNTTASCNLRAARNTIFNGLAQVVAYDTIDSCAFLTGGGMTVVNAASTGANVPSGMFQTYWATGTTFTLFGGVGSPVSYNTLTFPTEAAPPATLPTPLPTAAMRVDDVTNRSMRVSQVSVAGGATKTPVFSTDHGAV